MYSKIQDKCVHRRYIYFKLLKSNSIIKYKRSKLKKATALFLLLKAAESIYLKKDVGHSVIFYLYLF